MPAVNAKTFKAWAERIAEKYDPEETDLNKEIALIAKEASLNDEQIKRLVAHTNVEIFKKIFQDMEGAEDRYVRFKVAQYEEVKAELNKDVPAEGNLEKEGSSELKIYWDKLLKQTEFETNFAMTKVATYYTTDNERYFLKYNIRKYASKNPDDWKLACKIANSYGFGPYMKKLASELKLSYTYDKLTDKEKNFDVPITLEYINQLLKLPKGGKVNA